MTVPELPPQLRQRVQDPEQVKAHFFGYLPDDKDQILTVIDGITVKEVRVNSNIAVLNPGEAALSGGFALCSAVIAQKGEQLCVMHVFPLAVGVEDKLVDKAQTKILKPGECFDRVLLIGREASTHSDDFANISRQKPQIIELNTEKNGYFNLVVYNHSNSPGDITTFDLWFDSEDTFKYQPRNR